MRPKKYEHNGKELTINEIVELKGGGVSSTWVRKHLEGNNVDNIRLSVQEVIDKEVMSREAIAVKGAEGAAKKRQGNKPSDIMEARIDAAERLMEYGPTTVPEILESNPRLFESCAKIHNTMKAMEGRNIITKSASAPSKPSTYSLIRAAFNWRPQHPMINPPQFIMGELSCLSMRC